MINRLTKLREKMINMDLDGVLIFNPENRAYLSGFTGSAGCLLITKYKKILITDSRYTEQAKIQTTYDVIEHGLNMYDDLSQSITDLGIKKLGFEENHLTYMQYNKLKEKLKVKLVPQEETVEALRMIKQESETENIKRAVEIGEKGLNHIIGLIKPGVSEKELAVELEYFLKKNGAQDLSFDTIVASGARTSLPHAEPTDNKISYGDFVLIDFGCKVNGYCSDMTRTFVVGKASEKQRKIYNIVLNAQLEALTYIGKGKKCCDVDQVARNYIGKNGYGENFGHSLGHAVGMYIHENPRLSIKDQTELQEGMIVTVEPGIYIEGFGGVRIEDMVIIKENGIENLMKFPKGLTVI